MKSKILLSVISTLFAAVFAPMIYAEETKTILVGPELFDCVGVGPQKCMQVKGPGDSRWMNFYDKIRGFDFESGYEYELRVKITKVENPLLMHLP